MKQPSSILITGASSGIGRALALGYAAPGIALSLCGRNEARLGEVCAACSSAGAEVDGQVLDVTDREAMRRWIEQRDAGRALELVIANAGISGGTAGGGGESEDQTRRIFAVNLDGVMNTVLPAAALMRARRRGQIAVMSSLAAFRPLPGAPAYGASKAAVKGWGEAMRGVLGPSGVEVSVICPGFVESRMTAENTFPMPMRMTAKKSAAIIRRGLAAGRARIAFPLPVYAVAWLLAALPAGISERLVRTLPRKQ